jgi:hypothetical protein
MEQSLMDENDLKRMKTLASRADGDRSWLIEMDNWGEDLSNQDIRICDKNGKVLFTMIGGSLEHASYVASLNNLFVKEHK